jgi:two-component system response regulator
MDIEMPHMDGQSTLAAIRAEPEFRDIPVVMMTGVRDIEQMRLAARRGANSYNLKQADAARFLRTVKDSTSYWLSVHQHPTTDNS